MAIIYVNCNERTSAKRYEQRYGMAGGQKWRKIFQGGKSRKGLLLQPAATMPRMDDPEGTQQSNVYRAAYLAILP